MIVICVVISLLPTNCFLIELSLFHHHRHHRKLTLFSVEHDCGSLSCSFSRSLLAGNASTNSERLG